MPILYFLIAMLLVTGGGAATTLFRGTSNTTVCQPNLELKEWITVDIFPEKERLSTGAPLYIDKEGKLWVLIKRDAPIPAWKVWTGAGKIREGVMLGEMEEAGVVLSSSTPSYLGKRVFVGLGHCNGVPGSDCTDPLVQDSLFVAVKEGAQTPFSGCLAKFPDAASEECQKRPDYWWEFNVYLDASLLPPNPTNNDLPCWAKLACGKGDIMGENRIKVWKEFLRTGVCKAGEVLGATSDFPAFVLRTGINFADPAFDKSKLVEVYWYKEEVTTNPLDVGAIEIGTYLYNSSSLAVLYLEPGGVVFLSPLPSRNKFYAYEEIAKTVRPQGKTLQLGTFNPQRSLAYEWWTPACKPAIYLYPETPTQLSVKVKPKGRITVSDPYHGNDGWKVIAHPDGTIYESRIKNQESRIIASYGKDTSDGGRVVDEDSSEVEGSKQTDTFPYLYYEAELEKIKVPQEGWIVEREELQQFFDKILPQLGLNERESQDFLSYWIPKLKEYLSSQQSVKTPQGWPSLTWTPPTVEESEQTTASSKLFVGLIDREELDRVEPIEFSVKPDNFIRVRFYFERLAGDKINLMSNYSNYSKQIPNPPASAGSRLWRDKSQLGQLEIRNFNRKGFTVVDWGGILENGSCGIGEKSQ